MKKIDKIVTHFGGATYQKKIVFGRTWCSTWQWSDLPVIFLWNSWTWHVKILKNLICNHTNVICKRCMTTLILVFNINNRAALMRVSHLHLQKARVDLQGFTKLSFVTIYFASFLGQWISFTKTRARWLWLNTLLLSPIHAHIYCMRTGNDSEVNLPYGNFGCKLYEGPFTPWWLMKPGHGRWPFSMVRFLKKTWCTKPLGPFTRCKPNVDQEEWPCTKMWTCWCVSYMPKKGSFGKGKRKNQSSLTMFLGLLLSSSSFPPKKFHQNFIITIFLCHGPLPFFTRALLLPLPLQNPLNRVSG